MKRTLTTLAAVAMLGAGAASAVAPDSESLTYELNGEIPSVCELIPEGTIAASVDMLDYTPQGFAAVAYSCNSPYTLTIESLNGGMEHVESGGAITIEYDVNTFGFTAGSGAGPASFNSAAIQGSPAVVDQVTSWQNILTNAGLQLGNMDLVFPGLFDPDALVAGTYEDDLTLTLTADL